MTNDEIRTTNWLQLWSLACNNCFSPPLLFVPAVIPPAIDMRSYLQVLIVGALYSVCVPITSAPAGEPLTFERHVRPILKVHCYACHGEEAEHEGSLDLRQARTMIKGGDTGPAIVNGKASASLIVQRLESGEMPPEGKGKRVSAKDLATIRQWIDQ